MNLYPKSRFLHFFLIWACPFAALAFSNLQGFRYASAASGRAIRSYSSLYFLFVKHPSQHPALASSQICAVGYPLLSLTSQIEK